ncbi:MAG: hypothetical protein E7279_10695 [Lachnospiraceae bacterium]|nr:hypothetical protein [Lachnospiraceae bacterium]
MNGVNPIEIDKTAEYYNKLQETFKERINTKEELGSMLSNSLGEGDAVKVEISSKGLEMSEEVKRGEMPKGAIRQLEREPLTKEQLRSVPSGRFGEEILSKMQRVDSRAFEEYEKIRERREAEATDKNVNDEALFITRWAMRDELPNLSCWEDIDKRDKDIKVSSEGLSDKASQTTTMDTNNVDREIEKIKNKKAQLEQQLYSADETKKKELEQELRQVEAELAQKDNDAYRRQNAVVS